MDRQSDSTTEELEAPTRALPADGGGLVLGRYRLGRRLGSGGFGTVWEAHDERLARPVALKRIPVEGGGSPRAEREALAAARLGHAGVVALYDTGSDDEAFYLVSELVRGRSLAELERDGALSDRDVARVGAALCAALEHAHARGVVHRDVKPGNVIVSDAGEAKLTDFGIARLADHTALTRTGDVVGTLAYMAPEQAEGRSVGPEADLYALALVLFEALTGTNPVRAEGPAATARRVGVRLPPLGRLRRDLPRGLGAALDRALDPDPARRGSLAGLAAALRAAEPLLDDVPGPIGDERTLPWRPPERAPEPPPVPVRPAGAHAMPVPVRDDEDPYADARGRRRPGAPARVAAGVAAGALAAAALAAAPVALPAGLTVAAVAATTGIAAALLPRLAWLAAAVVLVVALAADGAGAEALVVAAAALPVAALLPRAGLWWSAPAAAPVLGLVGLAGAYPALAGAHRAPLTRLALGALGAWWLGVAAELADRRPAPGDLLTAEVLAPAAPWAVAALVLPVLVAGRGRVPDLLGAAVWAAGLAVATPAFAEALEVAAPPHAALGAVVGAVLALVARWRD